MKIGLKYCGGCNPLYERNKIVKRMRKDYPWVSVEAISEDGVYDWILIICGCKAECSSYDHLDGKFGKIMIYQEDDYEKIVDILGGVMK